MHTYKALALALSVSFLLPSARADNAAVRKQLESQMARFQQAFRRKDIAALRSITTPDFIARSVDGRAISRREAEVAMATEMNSIQAIPNWTLTIEKLNVKGSVATAIVRERMEARIANADGRTRSAVSNARMRETWVRGRDGWRYKRSEALAASNGPSDMHFVSASSLNERRPGYAAARRAIEARYAAYQRAIRSRDLRGALSTMSGDLTTVYPNGQTFDRKQSERSLQQMLRGLRSVPEWTIKIANLDLQGDSAVATIGERMVTVYVSSSGTRHRQTLVDFYQDTWTRTGRGWLLCKTKVLRGTVTQDGRTRDAFK